MVPKKKKDILKKAVKSKLFAKLSARERATTTREGEGQEWSQPTTAQTEYIYALDDELNDGMGKFSLVIVFIVNHLSAYILI